MSKCDPVARRKKHKGSTCAPRSAVDTIFHHQHRRALARELLFAIVLGPSAEGEDEADVREEDLLGLLDSALRDPTPRLNTPQTRILVRYCLHVSQFIPNDWIAPLQSSLLDKIRGTVDQSHQSIWNRLEMDVRKNYKRCVKMAAYDFILRNDGAHRTIVAADDAVLDSRRGSLLNNRRTLAKKLSVHHFYGRKLVVVWHKYIR